MNELRTALCDLLGIRYPILQSGMGGVAGPELVAEVSRAGGLGILAGLRLSKDQLRQGVRRVRELTDRPFGVNDLGEGSIDERKAGAKNLVATNDFVDGALQDGNIESSNDAKAHRNVPAGIAGLKAVKIPKRLLRKGCGETVERLAQCRRVWHGR